MLMTRTLLPAVALVLGLGEFVAVESADKPAVTIEIHKAETKPADGLTEAQVEGTENKVYLHKDAALTNNDIAATQLGGGDQTTLEITFTDEGKKKIAKLTEDHMGKPLAIVVNGTVLAALVVRSKIEDKASISVGTK